MAVNHVNDAMADDTALAYNLNKQTQYVENTGGSQIDGQNNNNSSTQLNDNAQQSAKGISVINASTSAVNFGINVVRASDLSDDVSQVNSQYATNMSNYATANFALAGNGEFAPATQTISNGYYDAETDSIASVSNQNNNNNSVQANGNAQENAVVESILNSAQSAVNISGNLASLGDVSESSVLQVNKNSASNHNNIAVAGEMALAGNLNKQTQNVFNAPLEDWAGDTALVEDQNNNNNSVQLNDNAQRAVQGVLLENSASSATNAALNALSVASLTTSEVSQLNFQEASNYENEAYAEGVAFASNLELTEASGQLVYNEHASINQDNNNNSVQLNDNAQASMVVDKAINSANSAVNAAQNLMSAGDISGSSILQYNEQYAGNHNNYATAVEAYAQNLNKQTQIIENCFCTDLSEGHSQDNNMNSVQLNDNAQQNAKATMIINAANSAVNGALNLLAAATVTDSHIVQANVNTAVNFSNVSTGGTLAVSSNTEGMILFAPPIL